MDNRPLTGGSRAWLKGRKDSRTSLAHAPLSFPLPPSRKWSPKRVGTVIVGAVILLFVVTLRRRTVALSERKLSSDEVERVWRWEIAAGRYPQRQPVPLTFESSLRVLGAEVQNPAVPAAEDSGLQHLSPGQLRPVGAVRSYHPIQARPRLHAAQPNEPQSFGPTRPRAGAVLDMDVVMAHCDFSEDRYVRDCLDVLRLNGGLDDGTRTGSAPSSWEATYAEAERGGELPGLRTRDASQAEVERLGRIGGVQRLLNSTREEFNQLVDVQQKLTLAGQSVTHDAVARSEFLRLIACRHSAPTRLS